MRRLLIFVILLGGAAVCEAQKPVVDRVLVVVNRRVITQSDWLQQIGFEALMSGSAEVTTSEVALERLIDRELVTAQLKETPFDRINRAESGAEAARIRNEIASGKSDAEWDALLDRHYLTQEEFVQRVAEQQDILRFIDQKFRPGVQISREQIDNYYATKFVPEIKKKDAAAPLPTVEAVRERILRILTEEKVDELFTSWLKALRTETNIRRLALPVKMK